MTTMLFFPKSHQVKQWSISMKPFVMKEITTNIEAYSVAGEMGFGWWLVEHYLSYHVDCPNSCRLGEPARGG